MVTAQTSVPATTTTGVFTTTGPKELTMPTLWLVTIRRRAPVPGPPAPAQPDPQTRLDPAA